MSHHKHTPKQMERINAFLKKAGQEDRLPESYFAHLKYEIDLIGYEGFANIQAEFASINPVVALRYLINGELPDLGPNKSMRKCVSSALLEASIFGDVKCAEGLIRDLGADVNYMDKKGTTPLYHAVRRKRLGMAEMLLKHGAKNQAGKDRLDPLSLACAMDFPLAIPLFMKYGVDINAARPFKVWNRFHLGYKTFYAYPLAIAVSQNSPRATQTLLDKGAKMDLKIRPNLMIREFMENNLEGMPADMQLVVNNALSKPQKDVLIPEVLPPEPVVDPHIEVNIHIGSITVHKGGKTPEKVATQSQPTLTIDSSRTRI